MTNQEVVEAIKHKKTDEIWLYFVKNEKLISKCRKTIKRKGFSDTKEIDSLIYQCIAKFIDGLNNFDLNKKISPYFIAICRNYAIKIKKDQLRQKDAEREGTRLLSLALRGEEELNPNDYYFIELVDKILLQLPSTCQSIFKEQYIEDLKTGLIASLLGMKGQYISKRSPICLEQFIELFINDPEGREYYKDRGKEVI